MLRLAPLIGLILAFIVLGGAYIAVTPYRQSGVLVSQRDATGRPLRVPDIGSPDERQHANYVQYLLDGKGFPILVPNDPNLGEMYESHQPPLYYLIAAGWAKLGGSSPSEETSGTWMRSINLLIGATCLLAIYLAVIWGLGNVSLALTAVAFAGLNPMFLAMHASVSNDPLLFSLCSWVLALAIRARGQAWPLKTSILLGVLMGMAFLTKTTAIALVPAVLVVVWSTDRKTVPFTRWTAWALIAILIGLPWWLRNQSLYGDPFALKAFNQAFTGSPQASLFIESFGAFGYWFQWVGWWTARSFVGVFGYMDVFLASWVYVASLIPIAIFGVIGFLSAFQRKEVGEDRRWFHVTQLCFLVVIGLLFIQFNRTYFQAQARYLFPAVEPISIGLGLGFITLLGKRSSWGWAIAATLLVALNFGVLVYLRDAFMLRSLS